MSYYVSTGSFRRRICAASPEAAAIELLGLEDGPFGTLIAVSGSDFDSIDSQFFHTKTLLDDIDLSFVQTNDCRIFSLVNFQEVF